MNQTRIIYQIEEHQAVFAKDDTERVCSIDTRTKIIKEYKTQKAAETFAAKYSKTNDLDYPLRVEKVHQYRPSLPMGYSYRKNKGWQIEDYDNDILLISEWWEGKNVL